MYKSEQSLFREGNLGVAPTLIFIRNNVCLYAYTKTRRLEPHGGMKARVWA